MSWLKQNGFHSYALTQTGSETLAKVKFKLPMILWVGAEGLGLPDELAQACDERVSIPMSGKVESLNVGVAASIALFQARM
jgi:tRNA G18 (ribose-2'-O)-methylase SpoU